MEEPRRAFVDTKEHTILNPFIEPLQLPQFVTKRPNRDLLGTQPFRTEYLKIKRQTSKRFRSFPCQLSQIVSDRPVVPFRIVQNF